MSSTPENQKLLEFNSKIQDELEILLAELNIKINPSELWGYSTTGNNYSIKIMDAHTAFDKNKKLYPKMIEIFFNNLNSIGVTF